MMFTAHLQENPVPPASPFLLYSHATVTLTALLTPDVGFFPIPDNSATPSGCSGTQLFPTLSTWRLHPDPQVQAPVLHDCLLPTSHEIRKSQLSLVPLVRLISMPRIQENHLLAVYQFIIKGMVKDTGEHRMEGVHRTNVRGGGSSHALLRCAPLHTCPFSPTQELSAPCTFGIAVEALWVGVITH